ncbi:hypothetical protein VKT23_009387 [Stygiomarasmius scandens]|uniref:Transmembrane protein n=1 Tax=Marasmiellus scandens TaxID=2682957 RepID=A0ABR1JFY5_9AGAR
MGPNQTHNPILADETQPCVCSTVFFSLLVACTTCQNANVVLWGEYSSNCTHTFESEIPPNVTIPSGFAIPHWAFTPLLPDGDINSTAIREDHQPDVTTSPFPPTQTASSGTITPTQTVNSGGASLGKGRNIGPIVGGVVGVLGLGILVALAFLVRRRVIQKKSAPISTPLGWVSPEQRSSTYSHDKLHNRPYNPNDPTTFPSRFDNQAAEKPTFSTTITRATPSKHGEFNPYHPVPEI